MFWQFDVEPYVIAVMRRWDDEGRAKAIGELHRKRRRSVPALVAMMKSPLFNCAKHFNECDAAAQILLAMASIDQETHDLIVKRLVGSIGEQGFQVAPSALLSALGQGAPRT